MKRANFLFGGLQEISASAQKHHSPIVKHPDAGAEQQRFPDIMSDKESGLAETIAQVEKLLLQFHASDRVERAKGLVQQQQRRIRSERAGSPWAAAAMYPNRPSGETTTADPPGSVSPICSSRPSPERR